MLVEYGIIANFEAENEEIIPMDALEPIKQKIFEIRGQRVMLDRDLAAIYGVEIRALNQAVKRNIERFPEDFMFQLTRSEWEILKSQSAALENWISQNVISSQPDNQQEELLTSQFVILKKGRGKHPKYLPYAFTELGVAMLSSVLRSPLAIQMNIGIMRAFVELRHMAATLPAPNADVAQLRRDFEELKLDIEEILADQNEINEDTRMQLELINQSLAALQSSAPSPKPRRRIGFIQEEEEGEGGKQ